MNRTVLATLSAFGLGLTLGLTSTAPQPERAAPPLVERVSGAVEEEASRMYPPSPSLAPMDATKRSHTGVAGTGANSTQPTVPEIAERAMAATAFVRSGGSYGAAVLLSDQGYLVTCKHVVEDARSITVTFADTGPIAAQLVESDERLDIALLKVDAAKGPPLPVARVSSVKLGDALLGMGSPRKLSFSLSRGLVSYVGRSFEGVYYLQTDLPTNSGNSGGPVLNDQGQVVGIMSFIFRDSEGLAFALPIDYAILRFARHLGGTQVESNEFAQWQSSVKQRDSRSALVP